MEKLQPSLRFPEFKGDWKLIKLNQLLDFKNGINASKEQYGKGYKFINVLDILNNDYINYDNIIGRVDIDENIASKNLVKYGDILFQRSSETREEVGSANVYLDKDKNAVFGGFVIRGAKIGDYEPVFFNKLLKTDLSRDEITKRAGGSTRYNIGQDTLSNISLPFPSLSEQQKIASFLTAVDEKLALLKEKKNKLEQYKKGVMQKIFSQELRFKDEEGNEYPEWEEKRLGEVVLIQGGFAFKSQLFGKGKNKVLRIGDITKNILNENFTGVYSSELPNDKYKVSKGDFVIALSGATFGKIGRINDNIEYYINQRVATFRTEQCLNFFFYVMQNHTFIEYIQSIPSTGAQPNISNDDIGRFIFPVPSIEEQTKIANFLSVIDEKIEIVNQQIKNTEEYKKGLLQGMFC